jgi:PAS domain S-box-containing protein
MTDQEKNKEQLIKELTEMRQRVAVLEALEAEQRHDIAERKQAERELAKHRAMLQATIDCLPFNFFAIGLDGRYTMQNAVSKAREPADVIGKRPEEVCPNEHDMAIWLENNRRAFAGEKVEGEVTLSLGGEERSYHNVIVPISDGTELYGILGVNIDITERKLAEKALPKARDELERRVEQRTAELTRANEELAIFRKFAETSAQGFSMADLDGHVTYLNTALCRVLGEDRPEDVVGKHLSNYFSEESNLIGQQVIQPALQRDGYWQGELRVRSRQGTSTPTWHHTFLIRDEKGRPLRIAVVITDITDRKRAEEALRQKHHTLKHLLQSSDHERQLIAYEIHDGLAQLLAGALMQFETFAHLKNTQQEQAEEVFRAGVTMLRQCHFETRRLISGVRPPILDESGVVKAVAHLVHEQRRGTAQKIYFRSRVDFDRLAPTLENAIYRIAQEGLANACRHSKSEEVRVALTQRGNRIRVEIRDWGVGFDAKAVPRDRFGLEGIRQRARLLGGKCSVRSSPGKGTRIAVELPVAGKE